MISRIISAALLTISLSVSADDFTNNKLQFDGTINKPLAFSLDTNEVEQGDDDC